MSCNNCNNRNQQTYRAGNSNRNSYNGRNMNLYNQQMMNMQTHFGGNHADGMPIGMCYVPWQQWGDLYDLCTGYDAGTIFPELNKPYLGRSVK
jgi:hypothetical protein